MAELEGEVLDRKRGDTAPDRIVALDPVTGLPIDNTGFNYLMTINSEKDPDPVGPPVVGTEVAQIVGAPGGVDGSVTFIWTGPDADQVPGTYWYDIQQIDLAGSILTIAKNKYVFHMDVTK